MRIRWYSSKENGGSHSRGGWWRYSMPSFIVSYSVRPWYNILMIFDDKSQGEVFIQFCWKALCVWRRGSDDLLYSEEESIIQWRISVFRVALFYSKRDIDIYWKVVVMTLIFSDVSVIPFQRLQFWPDVLREGRKYSVFWFGESIDILILIQSLLLKPILLWLTIQYSLTFCWPMMREEVMLIFRDMLEKPIDHSILKWWRPIPIIRWPVIFNIVTDDDIWWGINDIPSIVVIALIPYSSAY